MSAPTHTEQVFDPKTFPWIVDWTVSTCRKNGYQALAASGHSGLLVAGAAAYILGLPVIAVRKSDDHASGDNSDVNAVLYFNDAPRYVIIDDLVCSGATVLRIVEHVHRAYPAARLGGLLLYYQKSDWCTKAVHDLNVPIFLRCGEKNIGSDL